MADYNDNDNNNNNNDYNLKELVEKAEYNGLEDIDAEKYTEEIEKQEPDFDDQEFSRNMPEVEVKNADEYDPTDPFGLKTLLVDVRKNDKIDFPDTLADTTLERRYIGLLLNEVKAIAVYYYKFDECFFVDDNLLNIYKKVLFTDGERFAPQAAKDGFNYAKENAKLYDLKMVIQAEFENSKFDMETTYNDLRKIFTLRKNYLNVPVQKIQEKIADIINYELYDQMTVEDVQAAVDQITSTEKFKRAVLNENLTEFLIEGDNALSTGLSIPFRILSETFKGIRTGETSSFAMPSNSGKSRFTMNLAAYLAIVHKKKVLVISNEMSEDKMKLCLITTIINNPDIQKLHGERVFVSENELLGLLFKPDDPNAVEVDEKGYIKKHDGETNVDFSERLKQFSSTFRSVCKITDWFNSSLYNSIHFINITDHTNDELKKVIMNYYFKEKVQYIFYDTMKTDIENIGNGEELKKTATILSNLAVNYKLYIGTTLQLTETTTDPINLDVNDMAVSRTVKEVLDTLCLFKQIHNDKLDRYQYSLSETDEQVFELEKFKDPNVRYYTCVVDKNRAGPKPKLLFRLNLAYNRWQELGYIRLKNSSDNNG